MSQFARFVKPGAVRLGAGANSRNEVLISAYRSGTQKVVVAINKSSYDVKQKITFQGGSATTVIPYVTMSSKNAEQGQAITITANSFEHIIPAKSVMTFVEQ